MFITLKNVKEYVEQSEPGSVVGRCGSAFHCLIAEAVMEKYPEVTVVEVGLGNENAAPTILNRTSEWKLVPITTGDDGEKLLRLGHAFDDLGDYYEKVTREQALELFR